MPKTNYADWLLKALADTNTSKAELARHLGLDRSQVSRMTTGERSIKADEIDTIARFLGLRSPISDTTIKASAHNVAHTNIIIKGSIKTGAWSEMSVEYQRSFSIPHVSDPRFTKAEQSAYQMDEDAPHAGLKQNDFVIVVPAQQYRSSPIDRDVFVRQKKSGHLHQFQLLMRINQSWTNAVTGQVEDDVSVSDLVGWVIASWRPFV